MAEQARDNIHHPIDGRHPVNNEHLNNNQNLVNQQPVNIQRPVGDLDLSNIDWDYISSNLGNQYVDNNQDANGNLHHLGNQYLANDLDNMGNVGPAMGNGTFMDVAYPAQHEPLPNNNIFAGNGQAVVGEFVANEGRLDNAFPFDDFIMDDNELFRGIDQPI